MRERARDVGIVAVLFVAVIVTLALGYSSPLRASILLVAVVALMSTAWNTRADVMLGITGIIVGPLIELAATSSGLWRYASPSVAGLPLWVVPMWWIYPVTVARLIAAATNQRLVARSAKSAALLIAVEVPWLCAFGVNQPVIALIGVLLLLAWQLSNRHTINDVVALVICGLIGPGAEMIPVWMGAWSYPDGALVGLPLWLPAGYGVFGGALIQLGLSLARHRHRDALAQSIKPLRQLHDAEAKQRVAGWQP